jgi:cell division protein FtsB
MRLGTIIIAALLIYFSYITIEQEKILKNKNKELLNINNTISEEKKMQLKLEEQLNSVSTEDFIEKAARQKLGLIKEGERIFVDVNK